MGNERTGESAGHSVRFTRVSYLIRTLSGLSPTDKKKRGAVSNPSGRFEPNKREVFDDGWEHEPVRSRETHTHRDATRSLITGNDSPDIPFSRSINPYRGCEHGCSYCFARPSHEYLGLSAGLDFETEIYVKQDVASVLQREFARPKYTPQVLAVGASTDPYQPIERELRVTRSLLELLVECRHPFSVITKSSGVLRDIDLLKQAASFGIGQVMVSVTTLDKSLARAMEPRASSPPARIAAVRELAGAGVPVGVLVSPIIPALNDGELEGILEAVAAAGAGYAGYLLLRLPHGLKELFTEWLEQHYPDRAGRVLALVRQTRGGKLYDSRFGTRMTGTGPYATLLGDRYRLAAKRLGLDKGLPSLDVSKFRKPPRAVAGQLRLF